MSYPKVMIHEGKHDNRYILIQNPAEIDPAYFAMFTAMDQNDCAYDGIEDKDDEFIMYTKARDLTLRMRTRQAAARWLLEHRTGYGMESENVYIRSLDTPDSLLEQYDV